jgi:phage gp16-like protein
MLAKLHIAAKDLGLSEEERRGILEAATGHRSAKDCSTAELAGVLNRLAARGWKPKARAPRPQEKERPGPKREDYYHIDKGDPNASQKRLIAALWCKELGWPASALDARCERQFGVSRFAWLHSQEALQTLGKDLVNRVARKRQREQARGARGV